MQLPTIDAVLTAARDALSRASIPDPARDAATLLQFVLDRPRTFLVAHPEHQLTDDEATAFAVAVERRSDREPLQYITGRQEFYGLEFAVEPGVLIPRPETEILVETAIEVLQNIERPVLLDIGTGTGCIPISILHNVRQAAGVAVDISHDALALAYRNAETHSVADRLEIIESDLFAGIDHRFHLIASNPPYIPTTDIDTLQPEVRDFEPIGALDGGPDGLDIIRRIVAEAPDHLHPRGHLLLEIGIGESDAVSALFDPAKWTSPELVPDLQGIPRIVVSRLKSV